MKNIFPAFEKNKTLKHIDKISFLCPESARKKHETQNLEETKKETSGIIINNWEEREEMIIWVDILF